MSAETTTIIRPQKGWLDIDWKEFWESRELLWLLVKRDVSVIYKQTVFGPVWFFIQPVLTALLFSVVFGRVAEIPTDGLPRILFYLSGLLIWNYFRGVLEGTGNAFASAQAIFSKVYFPRLIVPVTFPLSHLVFFFLNGAVFVVFYLYFVVHGLVASPTWWLLLLPLLLVYIAASSLGLGLLLTSLTTKYRDLRFALPFLLQAWMFASPVIYPLRGVSTPWIKAVVLLNPVAVAIESFRFMTLGHGLVTPLSLAVGVIVTSLFFVAGLAAFQHVQHDFVDTI